MFEKFTTKNNLPSFRLTQIQEQYFKKCIESWDELTTWPKDLRDKLKEEVPFSTLFNTQEFISDDKRTTKILSFTKDMSPVESVLMIGKERRSVCVSCMSGCPVGCKFCATGKMGFKKNLTTQEIIDQVMYFQRKLVKKDQKITNVVFMGMGEPLLNLPNVINAIKVLTDEKMLGLSDRRITLSTCGYVPQLKEFFKKNTGVRLAVSLHAPNQKLREKLMPTVAKANPLDKLMETIVEYQKKKNKKVTYEYIMLKDVNDTPEHAKELAKLLKNQIALVNLINFNPVDGIEYQPSTKKRILEFQYVLTERGINNTLRYSQGQDVSAACGQLAHHSENL